FIGMNIDDRSRIEFGAVDVSRDHIDHRVPAVAWLEIQTGGAVAAAFCGLLGAVVEGFERLDEFGALFLREDVAEGLLAPRWVALVDFKIEMLGDSDKGIFICCMQQAAADI